MNTPHLVRFARRVLCVALAVCASSSLVAALPGGKANFSVCVGKMSVTSNTVVRLGNYTFKSDGTINATWWSWDSNNKTGKTALNTHTCTLDGVTKTCSVYTPTGWMAPAGYWYNRSGAYTYDPNTGVLNIAWNSPWVGVTEKWLVDAIDANLVSVDFVSSNYGLTHGRGYGSNASWSVYKTVTQVPRISYPGGYVRINNNGSSTTIVPTMGWKDETLNLAPTTSSANGYALHYWYNGPTPCGDGGGNPRQGIVYHLGSQNNNRSMAYNHWCASLATASSWPCYTRNMHPYAFQQIIDDTGAMRGFVGIEQQNMAGYNEYQYQLKAYCTP